MPNETHEIEAIVKEWGASTRFKLPITSLATSSLTIWYDLDDVVVVSAYGCPHLDKKLPAMISNLHGPVSLVSSEFPLIFE